MPRPLFIKCHLIAQNVLKITGQGIDLFHLLASTVPADGIAPLLGAGTFAGTMIVIKLIV